MTIELMNWALRQGRLSPAAKLALIYMADRGDMECVYTGRPSDLADFIGCRVSDLSGIFEELANRRAILIGDDGSIVLMQAWGRDDAAFWENPS